MINASFDAHELWYTRAIFASSAPPFFDSTDTRELGCTRAVIAWAPTYMLAVRHEVYDARELRYTRL